MDRWSLIFLFFYLGGGGEGDALPDSLARFARADRKQAAPATV